MTIADRQSDAAQGMEHILVTNRDRIVRFLVVRGAGDAAEDIFQELWIRLTQRPSGPVADPLAYAMRAANNLMLDRYRSRRQQEIREQAWGETAANPPPSAETALISREQLDAVQQVINGCGERAARVFRQFRVDGISQRDIAANCGVSLSTVESDLRKIYAALASHKRQHDA